MTEKNYNRLFITLCAVLFFVMLIFTCLTPLSSDDYFYSFRLTDWERIESVKDIFQSLVIHRETVNGRLIPHFFAYLMLFLPKWVFNIVNALNCVLLLFLQRKYFKTGNGLIDLIVSALAVLLIWNYLPAFGNVFFWLTGACNYTWCISLFLLYFLVPLSYFRGEYKGFSTVKSGLLLIAAFLVGTLSENGSFTMIFMTALVILYCYYVEHRFDLFLLFYMLAAVAGFLLLITAPPEISTRTGSFDLAVIAENIRAIVLKTYDELLPLVLIYAVMFVLNLKKDNCKILVLSMISFIGAFVSLSMFSVAAYFSDRHFCFTVFFLVLACLILLANYARENILIPKILLALSIVLFLFNFVVGTIDIGALYMNSLVRDVEIAEAQTSGESIVAITPFYPSSRYISVSLEDIAFTEEMPPDYDGNSFAKYYGFYYVYAKK